ncbi:hypothetical protein EDB81DRAFT_842367 [Dactylonectria macrodidyma]|uniref:Rhodopsin domain-containing protein n=1 Tax=Dactylonectria macrodidyma TaxID=307937 RepID=A0A9P9EVW4_9HYPO|nr:hypothetical protein EDB81DRAFT_842367 [Dactylonectria macrodidyma]
MADTTAPRIMTTMWVMTGVSAIFMSLRFFCKHRYGKATGWDDSILVFSWVCLVLYAALTTASCQKGIGMHLTDIPPDHLSEAIKLLYVGEFFAIVAVAVSKTSFAVTLLRLAERPWHSYVLWFIIVSLNSIMLLCGIFQFVQCSPTEKLWNLGVPGACWDPRININYAIFAGSYSAAADFILALFPWLLIWHLQMRKREKVGVAVAMSLGILASITAAVKTSYLPDIIRWADFTYSSADLLIWAASETAVTIIAASIPFLRLAFKETTEISVEYQNGDVESQGSGGNSILVERG